MIMRFVASLIPICGLALFVLWFFRAPESVAGLIGGVIGLLAGGADSIGRFVNAMTPTLNNLL